jgi:hypothetical protein
VRVGAWGNDRNLVDEPFAKGFKVDLELAAICYCVTADGCYDRSVGVECIWKLQQLCTVLLLRWRLASLQALHNK